MTSLGQGAEPWIAIFILLTSYFSLIAPGNFIKRIKKRLPEWLKSDEEKLEDVLLEIKSHIWDSAQEIAEPNEPDPMSIQKAINRLGTPKEIAKSYKQRGTPKYFISEELWPIFTKANSFLIGITFLKPQEKMVKNMSKIIFFAGLIMSILFLGNF